MSENSPFPISCIPNAGLPENIGGKAHYRLTPIELRMQLSNFINDLGVRIIGGCCGTTPDHIFQLSNLVKEVKDISISKKRKPQVLKGLTSLYEMKPGKVVWFCFYLFNIRAKLLHEMDPPSCLCFCFLIQY